MTQRIKRWWFSYCSLCVFILSLCQNHLKKNPHASGEEWYNKCSENQNWSKNGTISKQGKQTLSQIQRHNKACVKGSWETADDIKTVIRLFRCFRSSKPICFWLGKMVQGKRGCSRKTQLLLLVFSVEELMECWRYYYDESLERGVWLYWSRWGMMWAHRGDEACGMVKPTCSLESRYYFSSRFLNCYEVWNPFHQLHAISPLFPLFWFSLFLLLFCKLNLGSDHLKAKMPFSGAFFF